MATKATVKKNTNRCSIPRASDYAVEKIISPKVVVGFAKKEPRYIVEDINNVVYKKQ